TWCTRRRPSATASPTRRSSSPPLSGSAWRPRRASCSRTRSTGSSPPRRPAWHAWPCRERASTSRARARTRSSKRWSRSTACCSTAYFNRELLDLDEDALAGALLGRLDGGLFHPRGNVGQALGPTGFAEDLVAFLDVGEAVVEQREDRRGDLFAEAVARAQVLVDPHLHSHAENPCLSRFAALGVDGNVTMLPRRVNFPGHAG